MIKFKQFLNERQVLLHLNHLEDLVFIEGVKGAEKSLNYLKSIVNDIGSHETKLNVQQKIDGAPNITAGWDPKSGKFFVGTKSLFNKTPKINYNSDDVDKNHGHAPGLAKKLKEALIYLPKVIKKGEIITGDFMFSKDDLKDEIIDGIKVITFTPNTITYAVESGTKLAKKIKNSKIGVVFHTTYHGNSISDLQASFKISDSQLNDSKDVYVRTTNATLDNISWNKNEKKQLIEDIKILENSLKSFDKNQIQEISENKKLSRLIMTYINSKVKNGNHNFNNNEIRKLIDFIYTKYKKDIEKLKSETGKNKKEQEKINFVNNLRNYASTLYHLFEWVYAVKDIKLVILNKLQEIESKETPYIKTSDGYKITNPEGFVLSDTSDSGIKMVNRSVFSKNNFMNSRF